MDNKRVFLAIPIDKKLSNLIQEVKTPIEINSWKPTLPENLHITVHFFGNIESSLINPYIEKIGTLLQNEPYFKLETDDFEIKKSSNAMIWLKIKESDNFIRISRQIKELFQATDMRINPHITIGRFKKQNFKPNLPKLKKQIIEVNQIELWQSPPPTERPGYYKSLATFKLLS